MLPPPAPPAPVIQYVAGLPVQNPAHYDNTALLATQGTSQDAWFQSLHPDLCNMDMVPAIYRVCPNVNVCIWCNNGLEMDNPRRKGWYSEGHKAYGRDIADDRYFPACTAALGL
jgi:hypothetical protein